MFKFLKRKNDATPKEVETPKSVEKKKFTIEDITDEDMMVAALVASIDFQEESKGNVRVLSIKELL